VKKLLVAFAILGVVPGCKVADTVDAPKVAKMKDAEAVAKALIAAKLPVEKIKIVTAANDANSLLGRPGQYNSKVYFTDVRHPSKSDELDDVRNMIEMFDTEKDAKKRFDYVSAVTGSTPMFAEYGVLKGRIYGRFSKVMLPDEVKAYEAALTRLGG
jgi:hypothetical protein